MTKLVNKVLGMLGYVVTKKRLSPSDVDWGKYALFKPAEAPAGLDGCRYFDPNSIHNITVVVDTELEDVCSGSWYYTVTAAGLGGGLTTHQVHNRDLDIGEGYTLVTLVARELKTTTVEERRSRRIKAND
jgi:hypothetical protein